jgi:DNA-binding GntR family transcriptional regulator
MELCVDGTDDNSGAGGTRTASQTDDAYEAIRRAIIRWELAPGEQVSELQLAAAFGFGRAAVRAALSRLSHEQLIQAIPRRGYVIAPITFKQVQDMFGVRLIVEPAAARIVAARADDGVLLKLDELNQACEHRVDPYDVVALRHANKVFHVALTRATGNDQLADITSAAVDHLERILYLPQINARSGLVNSTFAEHELILDAIRAHDPKTAEQEMYNHILRNKDGVIEALLDSTAIRSINLGAGD